MTHHFFVVPCRQTFDYRLSTIDFRLSTFDFRLSTFDQGLADLRHKVGVIHPAGELLGTRTDSKNRHGSTRMTVVRPAEFSLVVQYADPCTSCRRMASNIGSALPS